jgi:hypothetical protein
LRLVKVAKSDQRNVDGIDREQPTVMGKAREEKYCQTYKKGSSEEHSPIQIDHKWWATV